MLRRLMVLAILAMSFAATVRSAAQLCNPNRYQGVDRQVCLSVSEAELRTDRGSPEAALAILKDLPTDAPVPEELRALVRSERIRAQRAMALKTHQSSGAVAVFWASVVSKATTLFSWLFLLALAALVVFGLAQLSRLRKPQGKTLLTFVDQTSDKPSDVGNLALTQEIDRLLNPSTESDSVNLIQQSPGNDSGATFINLQPLWGESSFATALGTAADVDLGAFKISSKALLQAWKIALRPRYSYTLQGVLSKTGETTTLFARMLDGRGRAIDSMSWSARAQGAEAREIVLREVTSKVITSKPNAAAAKEVWQSANYFRQAMDVCRDDKSVSALCAAQALLQKALKYDPSNWMARYNNALFLQMTGSYKASLQNWTFLVTALLRAGRTGPLSAPEKATLLAKVNYNRALTLARIGDWSELKQAIDILEELVGTQTGNLLWLARSALASALSTRYVLMVASQGHAKEKKAPTDSADGKPAEPASMQGTLAQSVAPIASSSVRLSAPEQTAAQIGAIVEELIEQLGSVEPISQELMLANAVARNARGRVLLIAGSYALALADFDAAILLSPDLLDPQLNAARAVRKRRKKDWTLQTEGYLLTALQLDPSNRQAHFLLGSLYLDPGVYRLKDASIQLEKASPDSWAAFELGGLYLNPSFDQPNNTKALEYFRKSVRLGDAVDIRALELVRLLLRVVGDKLAAMDSKKPTSDQPALTAADLLDMAREAEQVSKRIRRQGEQADVRAAANLEQQAHALVKKLQAPLAPSNIETPAGPEAPDAGYGSNPPEIAEEEHLPIDNDERGDRQ